MPSEYIYHFTDLMFWEQQPENDSYVSKTFSEEKFIHLSDYKHLQKSMELYASDDEQIILKINSNLVKGKLIWEFAPSRNAEFPHLYAPLNKNSIVETFRTSTKSIAGLIID
ncbi:MAG: hypothetical protein ACJAZ3_000249 [Sphingobacteriales bacterium]|jgi:uncharacterized protein (DUF952 family)